jgi:hypothetical protein
MEIVGNGPVYCLHATALRTLYAEVKERANATGDLLPGTPGTLVKRAGTGHEYWYRSYYPVPKKRSEQFVGTASNSAAYEAMQRRIAGSEWTTKQVAALSKLGYQVADKSVASVLVELHNRKAFETGLVVVGSLAYMAWLNEYGAAASIVKTQGVDLARQQPLKLATPVSFLSAMQATHLPFAATAASPNNKAPTSVKLPGAEGLCVDLFAPGAILGEIVPVRELEWHARAIPYFDYLLERTHAAAILAGGHCIPVKLPEVTRMIWHKLYSSMRHGKDQARAEKDIAQAVILAAILTEQQGQSLRESFRHAPLDLRKAARSRLPRIDKLLAEHQHVRDEFRKLR